MQKCKDLIDFDLPKGSSITFSSQPTPTSCTSYTLSNMGIVNGSISYIYSTRDLEPIPPSKDISLRDAIPGYRVLKPLKPLEDPMYWEVWKDGLRVDTRGMHSTFHFFLKPILTSLQIHCCMAEYTFHKTA